MFPADLRRFNTADCRRSASNNLRVFSRHKTKLFLLSFTKRIMQICKNLRALDLRKSAGNKSYTSKKRYPFLPLNNPATITQINYYE